MSTGFFNVPTPNNEPVKSYAPGSEERKAVLVQYKAYYNDDIDIPMYINGQEVRTRNTVTISPPHDHKHIVGKYHLAEKKHVNDAITTALNAREAWGNLPWEQRAAIFLKAADLLAGPYRAKINAATMMAQSKTVHQAEIDAACEMIDFLRFNVKFMSDIYKDQPVSSEGIWNRVEYRPLEGFIYAITPFNFTAIAGNLPTSAAMMGNVVVWKPSDSQVYSAKVLMDVFRVAGVPDGVINMIYGDPVMITDTILSSPDFAGLHYTGSTHVFQELWKKIGSNIYTYKTYPKIVGETGGKDFVIAHPTANSQQVATAISRGGFEFQGQKCSAASRIYLPESKAQEIIDLVKKDIDSMKIGSPEDTTNFLGAVIHERAFDNIASYIDAVANDDNAEIIAGGTYDKSKGYFVTPTLIQVKDPKYTTMCTEIFGPIVTVYVYKDNEWSDMLALADSTSDYALTGAIFAQDRYALNEATQRLRDNAGNFYINDKPTGAVVGQQPFGGARLSGTNDKAGSILNLIRWVSPRLIKETFVAPKDYRYPFLDK